MRDETKLLHNLMIYERHRREILGVRNRRLLGKTKSSRILEEQNTALRDQLTTLHRETVSLLEQLETVRKEKHEVEEARAMAAKQRVQQIEELVSENGNLKEEVRVLNERLKTQADELGQVRKEMSLVESSLFRANSEVSNDYQYTYQGFAKLLHRIRSPTPRMLSPQMRPKDLVSTCPHLFDMGFARFIFLYLNS